MEKECYFTNHNMGERSRTWTAECKSIRPVPPLLSDPPRTALLVLDMQGFFLDPDAHAFIPAATPLFSTIPPLIRRVTDQGGTVVFTRHISSPDSRDPMRRRWPRAMKESDPLSRISSQLDTSRGIVRIKHAFSAFYATDLEEWLRNRGITRLIITGVMTHLCCDTTARDAFMRGFDLLFTVDGTATYTEALHLGSLRALSHGFATCIPCAEAIP